MQTSSSFPSLALPQEQLDLTRTIPLKPTPVILRGKHVILRPLDTIRDGPALFARSNGGAFDLGGQHFPAFDSDALIWRFMLSGPFPHYDAFSTYLTALSLAPAALSFCVCDAQTEEALGICNLINNTPAFLRVELGGIWYCPAAQRTWANTEAAYLMMDHVFRLGYRRVEWKCDSANTRSRDAALKLGFKFEGIQEFHMIVKGRNRDTAWFRMLDHEWPEAKRNIEARIYSN